MMLGRLKACALLSDGVSAGSAGPGTRHLGRSIPAGLVDSGLSSLATFAVSLVAVHQLSAAQLGGYSLFFTTFVFCGAVTHSAIAAPAEVYAVDLPPALRSGVLRRSVPAGLRISGAVAVLNLAVLALPSDLSLTSRLPFALTTLALCVTSPIQDHSRRILHMAQRSWAAATASGLHLATTLLVLVVLLALPIGNPWAPFGALAAGNAASLGLIAVLAWMQKAPPSWPGVYRLVRSGAWLLVGTGGLLAGSLVTVALVTSHSGAAAVGYAEAARTLSQPVTVAVVGVFSVLNAELMRSARDRDRAAYSKTVTRAFLVGGVAAALWLLILLLPPGHGFLQHQFAAAFEVSYLLPLVLLQQTLVYTALVYYDALFAAGRKRANAMVVLAAGVIQLLVTVATLSTGAFAIAWGGLAGALALHAGSVAVAVRHMRPSGPKTIVLLKDSVHVP